MMDWVGEVPVFQAPKKRKDCLKWKEVKFGSKPSGKMEIINADLSDLFKTKLEEQTGRELRWMEVSEQPKTGIAVKDLSKNKALSRALEGKRLKFTKEEFADCFKFPEFPEIQKFSYDSYMRVGDTAPDTSGPLYTRTGEKKCKHYLRYGTCKYGEGCLFDHPLDEKGEEKEPPPRYFRPSKSLKVEFTQDDFNKMSKEVQDILQKKPKTAGYVKVGDIKAGKTETYFEPVSFEPGHGLTWKYHEFETGKYKVANGQVVELTVRKPVTGISNGYRCFIYLVILCKGAIASVLCYYGAGWILFGNDEAGDLILNTLASSFIFSVGDIVYSGFTSKLGKAMCDPDRHIIEFCAREPAHKFSNRRNMVSWFVMAALLLVTTVALDTLWGCTSLIDWGFLGPVGSFSVEQEL